MRVGKLFHAIVIVGASLTSACGGTEADDAGNPSDAAADAGATDGGTRDAGAVDAGPMLADAGMDAGGLGAGTDAGPTDAAPPPDGAFDAGEDAMVLIL